MTKKKIRFFFLFLFFFFFFTCNMNERLSGYPYNYRASEEWNYLGIPLMSRKSAYSLSLSLSLSLCACSRRMSCVCVCVGTRAHFIDISKCTLSQRCVWKHLFWETRDHLLCWLLCWLTTIMWWPASESWLPLPFATSCHVVRQLGVSLAWLCVNSREYMWLLASFYDKWSGISTCSVPNN